MIKKGMGIPSYYKKLLTTVPGLIKRGRPDAGIDWLFMDFNCLIYHCLHRADTPVYPGEAGREEWEQQFITAIVQYCLKVIKEVAPRSGVFIAIDGVVPMAKMRQQRLRRFKSIWLKKEEAKANANANAKANGWDTNAITPGTLFMKKLHTGLADMIRHKGKSSWILSTSDQPGEGEHKLLAEWRSGKYQGHFAVYGLDADLIVLSLLGQEQCQLSNEIWLFREEIEKGQITYDAMGEEQFEWFSIHALRDWLSTEFSYNPLSEGQSILPRFQRGMDPQVKRQFILNYACAMSVLGNDFLPSSLGLKIREEGHAELLNLLRVQEPLVDSTTLEISLSGLTSLFARLVTQETDRIETYVAKKRMTARALAGTLCPLGDNNWPLAQVAEECLVNPANKRNLATDWQTRYFQHFFPGHRTPAHRDAICESYLYGIQWIWAYYTGQTSSVCFNWYYPHSLPPLWEWIYTYLRARALPTFPATISVRAEDIRSVEQLTLVLPLESWSLIPPCKEKQFPSLAPQFFPAAFSFESVGKRFFWECEAQIPMPSICELKATLT
jgi:5'-3' exonuclease